MRMFEKKNRQRRRGTVIVEFALTVPFLFIIIFGIIDFSRAYSELNAINSGLREGARTASVMKDIVGSAAQSIVRQRVQATASVFGYSSVDTNLVTLVLTPNATAPEFVTVQVTAHPVPLPVLGRFLGLAPFTITRSVRYRWERADD
jgi:Flp pilus assembly protein TadG